MRLLAVFFMLQLASIAQADQVLVNTRAHAAIVYPQGGQVTHLAKVSLAPGRHQLLLPDLPKELSLDVLRITSPDLVIGAVRFRNDLTPPRPNGDTSEVRAARAEVERIEDALVLLGDEAAQIANRIAAVEAERAFLAALAQSRTLPADPQALGAMAQMIGAQSLAALEAAQAARIEGRSIEARKKALTKDLAAARQTLAALVPEPVARAMLVVDVTAVEAVAEARLEVTYVSHRMSWRAAYDFRLGDGAAPRLTVARAALVAQDTGENWQGIKLRVSSQEPEGKIAPTELWPQPLEIYDPEELAKMAARPSAQRREFAGAARDTVVVEEMAAPQRTGLAVTYAFAVPVDVATGADHLRIPFDSLEFEAEVVARATPLFDQTAYVVAKVINTSDEPLLASSAALTFFEGAFIGINQTGDVAAGASFELPFGPIDGLSIKRDLLDRETGDRGILSRSNARSERARITLDNHSGRLWTVELRDRVPFSEQEDLEIEFSADPPPDVRDVDAKRGVMQWVIEMADDTQASVSTRLDLSWPSGMALR